MSSDDTTLLRSKQVAPLPIGSGGKNATKTQMNNTNIQLTMMASQANANTKYDPPVPPQVGVPVISQGFCSKSDSDTLPVVLSAIGGLFIVYGFIAK